jgi:hypothetical protein
MKKKLFRGVYALGVSDDAPLVRVVWTREDGQNIRREYPISERRSRVYRCAIACGKRMLDNRPVKFPSQLVAGSYMVCHPHQLDVTQRMGWRQPQARLLVENRLSWWARLLNWLRPLQHLVAR